MGRAKPRRFCAAPRDFRRRRATQLDFHAAQLDFHATQLDFLAARQTQRVNDFQNLAAAARYNQEDKLTRAQTQGRPTPAAARQHPSPPRRSNAPAATPNQQEETTPTRAAPRAKLKE
jgi:hypothetical protein